MAKLKENNDNKIKICYQLSSFMLLQKLQLQCVTRTHLKISCCISSIENG